MDDQHDAFFPFLHGLGHSDNLPDPFLVFLVILPVSYDLWATIEEFYSLLNVCDDFGSVLRHYDVCHDLALHLFFAQAHASLKYWNRKTTGWNAWGLTYTFIDLHERYLILQQTVEKVPWRRPAQQRDSPLDLGFRKRWQYSSKDSTYKGVLTNENRFERLNEEILINWWRSREK